MANRPDGRPAHEGNAERWGVFSIALLWLAARVLPFYWVFTALERKFDFEVPQVRKLLEYGFWARKGALLTPPADVGLFANPENFNYVNHPYPIFWLYAALYKIGGALLVYSFVAAVGLAACLMVYVILRRCFSASVAWTATALFTVAEGAIEFDFNTDVVAFGTVVWVTTLWLISRAQQARRDFSKMELWLMGLAIFASGQISWFALTTLPALLIISLPAKVKFSDAFRRPLRQPAWRALFLGGSATLLVFLVQVFLYSSGGGKDRDYLLEQLGLKGLSRWGSLPWMTARMIFAGAALWFGGLVALFQCRRLFKSNRLFLGAAVYLPTLLMVCLVLPGLLSRNQHGFKYPLFPCAILVGFALEAMRRTAWLKFAMVLMALGGILLSYAKVQVVNRASSAAYTLGKWISANSDPRDVILFNRKDATTPVRPYDVEFASRVGLSADRLVRLSITNTFSMAETARQFAQGRRNFLFLRDETQPISEELDQVLRHQSVLHSRTNLVVPEETPPVYKIARERLRSWMSGKSSVQAPPSAVTNSNAFSLTLYRLNHGGVGSLVSTNGSQDTGRRD